MDAAQLSKLLGRKFLEEGNYEGLGVPLGERAGNTAASSGGILDDLFAPEEGMVGLAVQSVGHALRAETDKVIIYVTKGAKKALNAVPKEIEGIPVEAILLGRPKAAPIAASSRLSPGNFYEKRGRFACGGSCGPSGENGAGTLGAFLNRGGQKLALSNNHVFAACNHTPTGMPILAPAAMDARRDRASPSELAVFEDMIELRSGFSELVQPMELDAAIAVVSDPAKISSWQGDDVNGYDTPSVVGTPAAKMRVKKFGRTTGFTEGEIEAFVPTEWLLPYDTRRFKAHVWFQNTWTVKTDDGSPFALAGDSGSLVVSEDGSSALGLIFAVTNRGDRAIFCELSPILRYFGNATLLSNHGL